MAAITTVRDRREIWTSNQKSKTLSVDVYLREEQSCQISPQSDLKQRSFRLFWRGHSNKKNKNNNV